VRTSPVQTFARESARIPRLPSTGATGSLRRSRIRGKCSHASLNVASGATQSTCVEYLRSKKCTREPNTARINMFASSTNTVSSSVPCAHGAAS
jgi:hypothetical protein